MMKTNTMAVTPPQGMYPPISPEFEGTDLEPIGRLLKKRVEAGIENLNPLIDRIRTWRDLYESMPMAGADRTTERSDFFVPKTQEVCNTLIAKTKRIILGPRPMLDARTARAEEYELGQKIQSAMDYQLREECNIEGVIDAMLRHTFIDSGCIVKVCWRRQNRQAIGRMPINEQTIQDFQAANIPMPEGIEESLGGQMDIISMDEVVDRPHMEVIPFDDFVMYPHTAKSIDAALMVGRRIPMTRSEINEGVADGLFSKKQVDKLFGPEGKKPAIWSDQFGSGDDDILQNLSLDGDSYADDEDVAAYEVWELCCAWDLKTSDGILRDCIFFIELSSGTVLGATVQPYAIPYGQKPYTRIQALPRMKSFFGYSIPDVIATPQAIINDIYNQNIDAGAIDNMILFGRRPSAKDSMGGEPLYHGDVLDLDSQSDLWQIPIQGSREGARIDIAMAETMIHNVSGVSPYMSGQPGPSERTLGEVTTVMAEGNDKLADMVQTITGEDGLARVIDQVLALNRQFMPTGMRYITEQIDPGNPSSMGLESISQEEMRTKVRLSFTGTPALASESLRLQRAEKLAMFTGQNPLTQISKARLHAVSREVIKAFGYPNYTDFIGTEEEARMADEEASQAGPPPPQINYSARMDEITTLAQLLKEQVPDAPFVDRFLMAVTLSQEAQGAMPAPMPGAEVGDMPDNAPGYETGEDMGGGIQ